MRRLRGIPNDTFEIWHFPFHKEVWVCLDSQLPHTASFHLRVYSFCNFITMNHFIWQMRCRSLLLSQLLSADWFPSELLFFRGSISINALLQNLILLYSTSERREDLCSKDTKCCLCHSWALSPLCSRMCPLRQCKQPWGIKPFVC